MPELIAVVGMGVEGMTGLSAEARTLIEGATLVAGGRRHLAQLGAHPAPRLAVEGDLKEVARQVRSASERGPVVVLASGDPNFFGIAALLRREIGQDRVRVVPHLSSVQLAFARIGEAWQDARFLSAHGRPLAPVVQQALRARKLAILTDPNHTPAVVAQALIAGGLEADCRAVVCERLGAADERVRSTTLAHAAQMETDALSLLLVFRDRAAGGGPLRFGQAESAFSHRQGQITKAEVRAVTLARLALRPFGVLWDIGAGSGSVAIEAAGLTPEAEVYAVERDAEQASRLRENADRHLAANLRVVEGEAPRALHSLPAPHSVFIGGSGGRLRGILHAASEQLRPGGRIVANFALLEHLTQARQQLLAAGLAAEVLEMSVARAASVAGGIRLSAENPVFILMAERVVQ